MAKVGNSNTKFHILALFLEFFSNVVDFAINSYVKCIFGAIFHFFAIPPSRSTGESRVADDHRLVYRGLRITCVDPLFATLLQFDRYRLLNCTCSR